MSQDNIVPVFCYTLGVALPFALACLAFWYRESSRSIRLVCLAWVVFGVAWGTLGFIRLFYSAHFSRQGRIALDHWKTHIGGIVVGLLISMLLSADFWKVSRHYRGYSWLRSKSEV